MTAIVQAVTAAVDGQDVRVEVEDRVAQALPGDVVRVVTRCCVEALRDAVADGGVTRVHVELEEMDGDLWFWVSDDGEPGPSPATRELLPRLPIEDRAWLRHLEVVTGPAGTCVEGRVHLSARGETARSDARVVAGR